MVKCGVISACVVWNDVLWIYGMVMLEIASPQDAEVILKAVNDSDQGARDRRAQNILSESLTNFLGNHVRYD